MLKQFALVVSIVMFIGISVVMYSSYNIYYACQAKCRTMRQEIAKLENNKRKQYLQSKKAIFGWCIRHSKNNVPVSEIERIIDEAANYDHPLLILAIIAVESHFDQTALSKKQAYGLMQVRWSVWKKDLKKLDLESPRSLFEIDNNIKAGNYVLTYYRNKTNTMKAALDKYVGVKSKYSTKVLTNYAELTLLMEGN